MSIKGERVYLWKFAANYRGYAIVPVETEKGLNIGIFDIFGVEINSPEIQATTLADIWEAGQSAVNDDIYRWITTSDQKFLEDLRHAGVFAPIG